MNTAINISGVNKYFRVATDTPDTLYESFVHFRHQRLAKLVAVKDITLAIAKGEWFGIIGPNGSGKTTLLKMISGIYKPDAGTITIRGQCTALLGLGTSFIHELTAHENVYLYGLVLGLTKARIRSRYNAIVSFSELESFMHMKLKYYSSGMRSRLAFAIALQLDSPILLLDEVFAVGDASFQDKALEELVRLRREHKTIVMVSHSLPRISARCDRAAFINKGVIEYVGPAAETVAAYQTFLKEKRQKLRHHLKNTSPAS